MKANTIASTKNGSAHHLCRIARCLKRHITIGTIEAPVKDWRGVRGGFMEYEEGRRVKFTEWLNGLEQKWEQSWEEYGTQKDGVVSREIET